MQLTVMPSGPLYRQAPQIGRGGLGCRIACVVQPSTRPGCNRRDVNNAAKSTAPHQRDWASTYQHGTGQVDSERVFPVRDSTYLATPGPATTALLTSMSSWPIRSFELDIGCSHRRLTAEVQSQSTDRQTCGQSIHGPLVEPTSFIGLSSDR